MNRSRVAFLLLLAALAGPAAAAPAVCIPKDDTIASAAFDGALRVCLSGGACFQVDLDTGRWTAGAAAIPLDHAATDRMSSLADDRGVKVCAWDGTACERVPLPGLAGADVRAVANDARSLVAIVPSDGNGVRVLDLPSGTLRYALRTWPAPNGDGGFETVRFLGDALYVTEGESPISSTARLFRARTGKLLAHVGKRRAEIDGVPPVQVEGPVYAFVGFGLDTLYLQDVATGKVTARIGLGHGQRSPEATMVLLAPTPDRRMLAVSAMPDERAVQLVDPRTRRRTAFAAPPPCP